MDVSNEVIAKAEALIRTPGAEISALYTALDSLPTSTNGDAGLITWHYVYHRGRAPRAISTSRGHWYKVTDSRGRVELATVRNPHDHREGVEFK